MLTAFLKYKKFILPLPVVAALTMQSLATAEGKQNGGPSIMKTNELITFLAGKWDNVSFEIENGRLPKREAYPETMIPKDEHTLSITAHGFRDGKDVTKDMRLELNGDKIIMSQGPFRAEGKREGNVYSLKGIFDGAEFRFRLYTIGDKYVFHREIWKDGKCLEVDMSYLVRLAPFLPLPNPLSEFKP